LLPSRCGFASIFYKSVLFRGTQPLVFRQRRALQRPVQAPCSGQTWNAFVGITRKISSPTFSPATITAPVFDQKSDAAIAETALAVFAVLPVFASAILGLQAAVVRRQRVDLETTPAVAVSCGTALIDAVCA
jgi:hypothetical protein